MEASGDTYYVRKILKEHGMTWSNFEKVWAKYYKSNSEVIKLINELKNQEVKLVVNWECSI